MNSSLPTRFPRWLAVAWAVGIPAPLVLIYALAAAFVGLGSIVPADLSGQERAWAALYCVWGMAGLFGFVSLCAAFASDISRPPKRWLVVGLTCALVAFGAFLALWLFGDLAESRRINPLSFWPVLFVGPFVASIYFLVRAIRHTKKEEHSFSFEVRQK